MSAIDAEPFPKPALIGAALLLSVALGAAGFGRLAHLRAPDADPTAGTPCVACASLRFADASAGAVVVIDADTGKTVARLGSGEGGFVRGVVRGLARERRGLGFGAARPFRLSLLDHGRLWLKDEATGRLIDLDSFGVDNRAAFAALLDADRRSR